MTLACSCDYADSPAFYSASIRTARKTYRCHDCSGEILPGEKYEYVSALWPSLSGNIEICRTCERCHDIRVWVQNSVPCFCYMHGDLEESAREAVEEAHWRAPEEAIGLQFGLLRRLHKRNLFNRARRAA